MPLELPAHKSQKLIYKYIDDQIVDVMNMEAFAFYEFFSIFLCMYSEQEADLTLSSMTNLASMQEQELFLIKTSVFTIVWDYTNPEKKAIKFKLNFTFQKVKMNVDYIFFCNCLFCMLRQTNIIVSKS